MKKIIFVGRTGAGKTTLTQALAGEALYYHKTQYIDHSQAFIDTPGEYVETKGLGHAVLLYSFEADVVGLLISAREEYTLFPPCIVGPSNRPVIGIVTQIDHPDADVPQAMLWLELCGCEDIFLVSSVTGEGVQALREYLA